MMAFGTWTLRVGVHDEQMRREVILETKGAPLHCLTARETHVKRDEDGGWPSTTDCIAVDDG